MIEIGKNCGNKSHCGGRSKFRTRDMSNAECFYCGETNYTQSYCPQFKQDSKSLKWMMKSKQKELLFFS